jgi:hypothetical protein
VNFFAYVELILQGLKPVPPSDWVRTRTALIELASVHEAEGDTTKHKVIWTYINIIDFEWEKTHERPVE